MQAAVLSYSRAPHARGRFHKRGERFYTKFKWDVLVPMETDRWVLEVGDCPRLA